MNPTKMKRRTKEFAKRIIEFCRELPSNREGRLIGNQLFKSGTSVAANYGRVVEEDRELTSLRKWA